MRREDCNEKIRGKVYLKQKNKPHSHKKKKIKESEI